MKLGKKLKKNSVAMDIINFGEVRFEPLSVSAPQSFVTPPRLCHLITPTPRLSPLAACTSTHCLPSDLAHIPAQEAENASKLEALLNAVNSDDNSHLVTVPPGPHVLSDILLSSPIVQGEDGGAGGVAMGGGGGGAGGGGGGDGFAEFGVDPTLDPEFAWALRASMEEERARQEAEAKKRADEEAKATGEGEPASAEGAGGSGEAMAVDTPAPTSGAAPAAADEEADEAALLEAAIAMSMPQGGMTTPAAAPAPTTPAAPQAAADKPAPAETPAPAPTADVAMDQAGDEDEDEALQLALAMCASPTRARRPACQQPRANLSHHCSSHICPPFARSMSQEGAPAPSPAPAPAPAPAADASASAMFQDAGFLQSVLGSLPGVDPNDPRIRSVLEKMPPADDKDKEKKEEEEKK